MSGAYQTLNYPECWPLQTYSPPAEDVRMAYAEGNIGDETFDRDIEWADNYPEPPTDAIVMRDDECMVSLTNPDIPHSFVSQLNADETNHIEADLEQPDWGVHNQGGSFERHIQLTITCKREELELVFDRIAEYKPDHD